MGEVTKLLERARGGDAAAWDRVVEPKKGTEGIDSSASITRLSGDLLQTGLRCAGSLAGSEWAFPLCHARLAWKCPGSRCTSPIAA